MTGSPKETPAGQIRPAAWRFAAEAHAGQRRATTELDFILHPESVTKLVAEAGGDDAMLDASLLHDVVEDTDVGIEAIAAEFGDDVAGLVAALTDDPAIEDYSARKAALREQVRAAGPRPVVIYAADKLDNSAALRAAYADVGDRVAERIKVPFGERIRIWKNDLAMARELLGETALIAALDNELGLLESTLPDSPSRSII